MKQQIDIPQPLSLFSLFPKKKKKRVVNKEMQEIWIKYVLQLIICWYWFISCDKYPLRKMLTKEETEYRVYVGSLYYFHNFSVYLKVF